MFNFIIRIYECRTLILSTHNRKKRNTYESQNENRILRYFPSAFALITVLKPNNCIILFYIPLTIYHFFFSSSSATLNHPLLVSLNCLYFFFNTFKTRSSVLTFLPISELIIFFPLNDISNFPCIYVCVYVYVRTRVRPYVSH